MKIKINNLDLPFTIDTYGMFNGESVDDMEADYYVNELGYEGEIDFDYDHEGIVKDLANFSVQTIHEVFNDYAEAASILRGMPMVLSFKSPQFYNFTTDSYVAEWNIDEKALLKAIENLTVDGESFQQYQLNSSWGLLDDQSEDYIVAALDFYGQQYKEEYEMKMFEHETEAYYENMKPSAAMQAELDKLEIQ